MGEGGVPPLSVNFFLLKIGLKTVFFGQKMLFVAENLSNFVRYGGGGVPPHSVNFFPLVFRKDVQGSLLIDEAPRLSIHKNSYLDLAV